MALRFSFGDARTPGWIRLQRAIGLGPLSLFAVYHLWQNWPALEGREAWTARAHPSALGRGLGISVLALLAVHAAVGVVRWARQRGTAPSQAPGQDAAHGAGRARFQVVTGALLLVFVVYHVLQVWPAGASAAHAAAYDGYELMWQRMGRPLHLLCYVLGTAALAFHLGHGWARSFEAKPGHGVRMSVRYVAGIAGLLLFVLYIQLVGRFALGEAVVPLEKAEVQLGPGE